MSTAPASQTIAVNGLSFPALVAGPESGPVVLCLHGFPDTRHGWFPATGPSVGAALAEAGFRVVAPAMRGTEPECIPPDGDYTPDALAGDVVALIDFMGGKAAVVGNDWGAFATYLAAARAPDKVTRAVTLAIPHPNSVKWTPPMVWRARHFITFQLQKRSAKVLRKDDFAQLETLYHRWSPTWRLPPDALAEVKNAYRKPGVVEGALAPYAAMRKHLAAASRELRQKITVPTLALYGTGDPSVPAIAYDKARRGFAGDYQFASIPTVGHFMQREDPAAVARHIIDFLRAP